MKRCLFVFGTRPEAIKLVPLIKTFRNSPHVDVRVCITAQHRQMLDQVLDFFEVTPDYDLNLMKPNQSLSDLMAHILLSLRDVVADYRPDYFVVQGDTTTVLAASVFAFYNQIKIIHVEAGLRSFDLKQPFPEEANRVLTSHIADLHFAPTEQAKQHLANESIHKNVYVVGNSVIDALFLAKDLVAKSEEVFREKYKAIDLSKRLILVTCHRRENFGSPLHDICEALATIAAEFADAHLVFPVHLNPNVREVVFSKLRGIPNLTLLDPLEYPDMVWFMTKSYLIITDSGGVQEEAPSLDKPVIVLREVTERQEAVEAGTAILVGADKHKIIATTRSLLLNKSDYDKRASLQNPYGDGTTSAQILQILESEN